eukprot:TRINITY_DN970_c0_g1_i9.p1 TRINITY_DN970_c0_g1~~TRINITY_DN970_c0_g1_i9.p1  ORF type:complete len:387 (-),score=97.92 TRINITY_DN970_c0_g1_i9:468-1628(-)
MSPINGIRYKCFVCSDFDLCEKCEATKTHDQTHPLVQIAQPNTFGGRGCHGRRRFHGPEGAVPPPHGFPFHPWRMHHMHNPHMNPNPMDFPPGMNVGVNPQQPPAVPVPGACLRKFGRGKGLARFVQDVTIEDGTVLKPNEPFVKVWRIRNSGEAAWPEGTVLLFVGGDLLGAPSQVAVPRTVNAGEEVDISVNMVAPERSGRYTGYWRLMWKQWYQRRVRGSAMDARKKLLDLLEKGGFRAGTGDNSIYFGNFEQVVRFIVEWEGFVQVFMTKESPSSTKERLNPTITNIIKGLKSFSKDESHIEGATLYIVFKKEANKEACLKRKPPFGRFRNREEEMGKHILKSSTKYTAYIAPIFREMAISDIRVGFAHITTKVRDICLLYD